MGRRPWQQACVARCSVHGKLRMRRGKDGGGRVSPDAEKATQPALEAGTRYSSDLISRHCKGIKICGKQASDVGVERIKQLIGKDCTL